MRWRTGRNRSDYFWNHPEVVSRWEQSGVVPLTNPARGQWSTLRMPVAGEVVTALRTRAYSDCTLKLMLNVSDSAGRFLFDNLAWRE